MAKDSKSNSEPVVIELKEFNVGVTLTPVVTVEGGVVTLEIKVEPAGEIKNPVGDTLVVRFPLDSFPDPTPKGIRKWAHDAYKLILHGRKGVNSPISAYLLNQAAQNYLDISLLELGQSPDEIIKAHHKFMGQFYRMNMKRTWRRGNFSPWTPAELENSVKVALLRLQPSQRTIGGVLGWLEKEEPERAPKSEKALYELIRAKGLSWKKLIKWAEEKEKRVN